MNSEGLVAETGYQSPGGFGQVRREKVTESARKRKHSQDGSDGRVPSTVQTGTDPDAPSKRLRNENRHVSFAITQDATTSGEYQPPSIPFLADRNHNHSQEASAGTTSSSLVTWTDQDTQFAFVQNASTSGEHLPPSIRFQVGNRIENTGNRNRSPDASAETTASSVLTGTDQDTQSAIVQDASTIGEGQPPGTDTPTAFSCPICQDISFRRDHIKRLRFSHVFHQSCIDM
ncbi:hypothetical protein AVEN_128818-1 [Araneus ventricosus]|uniref:Uncharacterized protein n=1 Tax=Araneus ventricosus TaxID=182803 RepID=A0A4Y2K5Z1_ARAVE|nr:hypothetical protein AVEN_128818-1 [Araneus ventricosus]